jgi:hypothetical protein
MVSATRSKLAGQAEVASFESVTGLEKQSSGLTPGDHDAEVSAARRVHAAGAGRRSFMTVQRLKHIGIVVDDLAPPTAFFASLVSR